MKSKIKKILFASVLTFGLIGATFASAPTAEASFSCKPINKPCEYPI